MPTPPAVDARALHDEVLEFHALYCRWLRGGFDGEQGAFDAQWLPRFHPRFSLVMPGGLALGMDDLRALFDESYGSNPDFATDVREFELLHLDGGTALVRFEEWHRGSLNSPRVDNGRLSSVLFVLDDPARVRWLHMHQTWLPDERVREEPFEF